MQQMLDGGQRHIARKVAVVRPAGLGKVVVLRQPVDIGQQLSIAGKLPAVLRQMRAHFC